jgi:hypothetical protein
MLANEKNFAKLGAGGFPEGRAEYTRVLPVALFDRRANQVSVRGFSRLTGKMPAPAADCRTAIVTPRCLG